MGGYTLGELDVREMKTTRKKFPAISSCGIAMDHGRNRVFLPRLLLGDLAVLDGDSLERVARIPLAPGLRDVLYIAKRDLVVVGNYFNGNLSILDGGTYRVLRTFWVGSKNRSLSYSPETDRLYVQTVNRILEIDLDQVLSPSAEHPWTPGDRQGKEKTGS
jgi:DNA-binding beta-propeller fold protein YncE